MTALDLRALVRDVCDTSPATDPATLAKEVRARLDRRQALDALDQCLPAYVHSYISRARGAHTDTPGGQLRTETHGAAAAGGQPSSKVASIREAWRRRLNERLAVGPDRADWKFLGDCSADDCDYAATIRENLAKANADSAEKYRELADAIRTSGVATVRDLPDVATRLGDAA